MLCWQLFMLLPASAMRAKVGQRHLSVPEAERRPPIPHLQRRERQQAGDGALQLNSCW